MFYYHMSSYLNFFKRNFNKIWIEMENWLISMVWLREQWNVLIATGRTEAKAIENNFFVSQERWLGDRNRLETDVVLAVNDAFQRTFIQGDSSLSLTFFNCDALVFFFWILMPIKICGVSYHWVRRWISYEYFLKIYF